MFSKRKNVEMSEHCQDLVKVLFVYRKKIPGSPRKTGFRKYRVRQIPSSGKTEFHKNQIQQILSSEAVMLGMSSFPAMHEVFNCFPIFVPNMTKNTVCSFDVRQ